MAELSDMVQQCTEELRVMGVMATKTGRTCAVVISTDTPNLSEKDIRTIADRLVGYGLLTSEEGPHSEDVGLWYRVAPDYRGWLGNKKDKILNFLRERYDGLVQRGLFVDHLFYPRLIW